MTLGERLQEDERAGIDLSMILSSGNPMLYNIECEIMPCSLRIVSVRKMNQTVQVILHSTRLVSAPREISR